MKKIKVIQIGIGHDHAAMILESLLKQSDIFDVAALAVPESEKTDFADRLKNYEKRVSIVSVEDAFAIPDIEAAVIET